MDIYIILLLIAASLLHSTWHSLVKISGNRLVSYSIINVFAAMIAGAYLLYDPYINEESYVFLAISVFLHFVYKIFLISAYRVSDFSLAFPISRGTSPVYIVVISSFYLDESVGQTKLALIISIGLLICLLSLPSFMKGRIGREGIFLAANTGLITALYSIVDGYGGRISENPISFICWMYVFDAAIFPPYTVIKYRDDAILLFLRYWKKSFAAAILSVVSYGIVVYSMSKINISEVAAIREINIVFATAIAYFYLKEHVSFYKWVIILLITVSVSALSYLRY